MRLAPLNAAMGLALDFSASNPLYPVTPAVSTGDLSTGTKVHPGMIISTQDTMGISTTTSVPNWGTCELMYVINRTGSAIIPGRLVHIDKDFGLLDMPNTAGTGRPVYVTLTHFAIGSTTPQGGWVMLSGIAPVSFSVAATVGIVFFGTAGQASPTQAAGKQINNAWTLIAAAGNFTRSMLTQSGSAFVRCNIQGMYPGLAFTGTGIPASSVISSISTGGDGIFIGSAVGTNVNATATGQVTGTFTHTGYGIVHFNRPFVQGQIL